MYVQCYSTYASYTWFRHVHTFMEIYRHVYTFVLIYKHVCTWYRHVYTWKGTNMYVHCLDVYVHVIQVYSRFDSYKHVHIMYKHVHIMYKHVHTCLFRISYSHSCMSRYVLLMFRVQMATYISRNVQTSLNCVHTPMSPFDFSFLFCPAQPGWLACREGLVAARCHTYSSSSIIV